MLLVSEAPPLRVSSGVKVSEPSYSAYTERTLLTTEVRKYSHSFTCLSLSDVFNDIVGAMHKLYWKQSPTVSLVAEKTKAFASLFLSWFSLIEMHLLRHHLLICSYERTCITLHMIMSVIGNFFINISFRNRWNSILMWRMPQHVYNQRR